MSISTPAPQVATQFISSLQDQAEEYLVCQLQALRAPAELIELVRLSRILAAYQAHPHTTPFIGIEDATLQTVNLLFQDKAGAA